MITHHRRLTSGQLGICLGQLRDRSTGIMLGLLRLTPIKGGKVEGDSSTSALSKSHSFFTRIVLFCRIVRIHAFYDS